ncbi:hypothetical protein FOCG_18127 [Fusarium oxysporum f. sp. radicis-lycopersici 26381]|nr:hypothetical protein FOCG_18127 [Fusarium oxysporum f. sp. radicis-lycopersici 26381]
MASGSKKNCSSLLVNAILAAACVGLFQHGYSKVDHRSRFWNPRTLGYQFLAEARRLWELEIGRARLTTIQAAVVLSIVCDANGSDEVGRAYLTQAVAAAYGMQLFSAHVKTNDDREYNARAVTAWGLFGLQAVHSFHVFKAPLLHMPPSIPLPDPSQQDDCYGDFWLRYPSSKVPVPVNYSNTFKAISEFRVIMNDVAAMFFSDFQITPDVATDRIQGFCIRLDSWHQNLPRDLKAREICFPWQLKLDMHYYHVIIFLLETLCKTSTSALHDQSIQKALSDAKIKMETLLRLYYLRHGFESYDIFLISLLSFLGFMHIKSLKSAEAMELESRRSTVVLMAKGLRDQSQNCFLAALVFRVLKAKMGRESQLLLKEVDVGEEDGEEDGEEEVVMADQVHSSWPIDIEWIDTDPDKQRLGNLIKETKGLRVC